MKLWIYDDDREIVTAQKPFQKGWTENMRKKSHISLARYIVANTEDEGLKKHWLSFYIGSVLPDCKPLLSINGMRLPVHFQNSGRI